MDIAVIGLGRLGCPLAAVLASKGHNVIGIDLNPRSVTAINAGRAPVEEPNLQERIDSAGPRLRATTNFADAIPQTDISFVIVPTPSGPDGMFSNRWVLDAVRQIGAALRVTDRYHVVNITSTVMPGSTGGEIRAALEQASGRKVGDALGLTYSPEFIALGSVVRDLLHPDMLLIGESDRHAGDVLEALYRQTVESNPPVQRMNWVNAEISKISVNTFVTTKISYANMLAELCDKHMDVLRRKRKLSFAISLDSIEEGYERIRRKGTWGLVERNILDIVELQRTQRPEWDLQTNALILKSGIPLLPRFAEWHARNHVVTSFYDFINSRGTEDAVLSENVLHNPQLLHDMPNWHDYFEESINIFRRAGLDIAASTLDHYRSRLGAAVAAYQEKIADGISVHGINTWEPILSSSGASEVSAQFGYCLAPGSTTTLYEIRHDETVFTGTREGDHAATDFIPIGVETGGGILRVRQRWDALGTRRRVHVWLQTGELHQLDADYQFSTVGDAATEMLMTAHLPPGEHRIRLVAMPVGEDECVFPGQLEFDLAGGRRLQPPQIAPFEAEGDQLNSEVEALQQQVAAISVSKGWRVAAPVRRLRRLLSRV